MRYIAIIFLFISTYSIGQITVNTNFLPNIASPIDTRQKIATLADTTSIPFQYTGAICYVTSKDSIYYKGTNGWKAIGKRGSSGGAGTVTSVAASSGTGISVSGSPITTSGTLTITNTAPDQTVVITGATGTYPNFTLPAEVGDISSVTVSAPITGGSTSGVANIALDTTSTTGAATQYDLTLKHNTLVSGTTLKTVNSNSLLGSGNVSITPESTTIGDTPTLNLSLTGVNITGVVDTSIIATQYDLTLVGGGGVDTIYSTEDVIPDSQDRLMKLKIGHGSETYDPSSTNEIQNIARQGDTLSLSGWMVPNSLTRALVPTGGLNGQMIKRDNSGTDYNWYNSRGIDSIVVLSNKYNIGFINIDSIGCTVLTIYRHFNHVDFVQSSNIGCVGGGIDSTIIIGGWGVNATESPLNTWNIIADTSQVATQYDLTLLGGGATQYLNPYIIATDTVGFYMTVAQDTVLFTATDSPTVTESTTVGDTPTINMTLTGYNITSDVIDGSITPAKLDRTYLTAEVDGSVTNEIELPSQPGNSGKYLTTNGTSPSWSTVAGGSASPFSVKISSGTLTVGSTSQTEWSGNFRDTIDADGYYKVELYASFISSVTTTGASFSIYNSSVTNAIGILEVANSNGSGTGTFSRKAYQDMTLEFINGTGATNTTDKQILYGQLTANFTSGAIIIPKFAAENANNVTYQAGARLIITKLF